LFLNFIFRMMVPSRTLTTVVVLLGLTYSSPTKAQSPAIVADGTAIVIQAPNGNIEFQTAACTSDASDSSICGMVNTISAMANTQQANSDLISLHGKEIASVTEAVNTLVGQDLSTQVEDLKNQLQNEQVQTGQQIADLTLRVNNLTAAVSKIYNCSAQGLLHGDEGCISPVPMCSAPPTVANSKVIIGLQSSGFYPYNTAVRYKCNKGYSMLSPESPLGVGTTALSTCNDHVWSTVPECVQPAGKSCKDVLSKNSSALSGPTLLYSPPYTFVGFCDMVTPSIDGKTKGFTLCSKYNANHPNGPRWLNQGFGRDNVNLKDMGSLDAFSGKATKWSSIDCRAIIRTGASYMMHASTNDPVALQTDMREQSGLKKWTLQFFTNIMSDVKADPTNLFDLTRDDKGNCTPNVMSTYNADGTKMIAYKGFKLQDRCMIGDGHHFCSYAREGSVLSNMRGSSRYIDKGVVNAACAGSQYDTVYWSWRDDKHFCDDRVVGTGCLYQNRGGIKVGLPQNTYNYLFVI